MRRFLLKLWRRRSLQADIETELAFHRDMAKAQQNPVGLGNVTLIQEQARDAWRFSFFEDFARSTKVAACSGVHCDSVSVAGSRHRSEYGDL